MNFKTLIFTSLILFGFSFFSISQNKPKFDVPEGDTVIVNSGTDFLILANLNDGDTGEQDLSFEISSSNSAILSVDSFSVSPGNKMALVWVTEQGVQGSVTVSASVTDEDGTTTKDFEVVVSEYTNHGIHFQVHDAVFWQEVVPLNDTPLYDSIVQSTNITAAYNSLDWSEIELTVSAGCDNASLCDGHDFSTGFMEGYLVPKKTGDYSFYMSGDGDFALFLSTDESFENARVIAAKSDNHGKVGGVIDGRKSDPVPLDSGKVYAVYAAVWNIHQEKAEVKWELPGELNKQFIDGSFLYPEYDTNRPAPVVNTRITATGDRFLNVAWDPTTDDQKLAGYTVYLNGIKMNSDAITSTNYTLEGLTASTGYSVAVTALDLVQNESFIDAIINTETLSPDTIPPTPPTSLSADVTTGLAVQVSWEGAGDAQTEVFGYNVYLNDELYNTDSLYSANSAVLKVLTPNTEYDVQVEALDAGMNVSEKSEVFKVSTSAFDPLGDNLGIKTGKLEFSTSAMSYNEGLGINPDYKSGEVFNSVHTTLFNDLKPGAIRWGALTANPLSFSDYAGAGKSVTIGKFMARCNEFGAFTTFCCGVENSTDWRKDPDTFLRFLEYINGPDDTPGGQLRVAEGYSEPFLKNSPGLIFEFGNEVWGGAGLHNAQIGEDYNEYAKWCREIAAKMKASPYYDSTKIFLAYSARYPSREKSYGLNDKIIEGNDGIVDWLAPSGYLGGNLNYDPALPQANSELEYYQNVRQLADTYLSGMLNSHKYEVNQTGYLMKQYMYESNTTTPTYNGRLGQALLSTDYYLTAMELGSAIPTIFNLTGGQWRITEPENNYRRLPLFITAKYINRFCKGDVLYNTYYSNQEGKSYQGAKFSSRPVGVHTYRNDQGYSIVFISRDYVDDHYVQIDLPEGLSLDQSGKIYMISGNDFSAKNTVVDSLETTIGDGMLIKVPKYSMVLVHFTAADVEMRNLPLAYYPYPRIQEIEIPQGNKTFSKPSETIPFSARITPTDSWDRQVVWTLQNNSGNFSITESGTFCYVTANRLENEADSLILRASSRDGEVYDEVVLYLPNTVDAATIQKRNELKIYPNPAQDLLTVEINADDTIRIFNVNGAKVFEKDVRAGRNEINLKKLKQGIYTIQVKGKAERLVIRK